MNSNDKKAKIGKKKPIGKEMSGILAEEYI
jgi:hypothetical protein